MSVQVLYEGGNVEHSCSIECTQFILGLQCCERTARSHASLGPDGRQVVLAHSSVLFLLCTPADDEGQVQVAVWVWTCPLPDGLSVSIPAGLLEGRAQPGKPYPSTGAQLHTCVYMHVLAALAVCDG